MEPNQPPRAQAGDEASRVMNSDQLLERLNNELSLSEGLTKRRQEFATTGQGRQIYDALSDPNKVMTGIDPNANLKQGVDLRQGYEQSIAKAGANTMDVLTAISSILKERKNAEQSAAELKLQEQKLKADLASKNMTIDEKTGEPRGMTQEELKSQGTQSEAKNQIITNIKDLLSGDTNPITGLIRYGFIPGTEAKSKQVIFDNLKSLLSLDNIKYLKGQGAVSDAERKLLEKASSRLDPTMSDKDFRKELENLYKGLTGENITEKQKGRFTIEEVK